MLPKTLMAGNMNKRLDMLYSANINRADKKHSNMNSQLDRNPYKLAFVNHEMVWEARTFNSFANHWEQKRDHGGQTGLEECGCRE
jgi:hypothetical protein